MYMLINVPFAFILFHVSVSGFVRNDSVNFTDINGISDDEDDGSGDLTSLMVLSNNESIATSNGTNVFNIVQSGVYGNHNDSGATNIYQQVNESSKATINTSREINSTTTTTSNPTTIMTFFRGMIPLGAFKPPWRPTRTADPTTDTAKTSIYPTITSNSTTIMTFPNKIPLGAFNPPWGTTHPTRTADPTTNSAKTSIYPTITSNSTGIMTFPNKIPPGAFNPPWGTTHPTRTKANLIDLLNLTTKTTHQRTTNNANATIITIVVNTRNTEITRKYKTSTLNLKANLTAMSKPATITTNSTTIPTTGTKHTAITVNQTKTTETTTTKDIPTTSNATEATVTTASSTTTAYPNTVTTRTNGGATRANPITNSTTSLKNIPLKTTGLTTEQYALIIGVTVVSVVTIPALTILLKKKLCPCENRVTSLS